MRYTSPNEHFEMVISILMHFCAYVYHLKIYVLSEIGALQATESHVIKQTVT